MQKKLLVLAVASALGAPALAQAQASSIQIYGKFYEEYGFAKPSSIYNKGSAQNVDILQAPGSNIGFKGQENLGGGMAAWFQCESTADPRGGNDGFCSRNSAVGLKGTFGNLFVGEWDTPFKRATIHNNIVDLTGLGGTSFLLAGGATTETGNGLQGLFYRRQRQSIDYDSPVFNGFQFMVSTSTGNSATSATSAAVDAKPRVVSLGAMYHNGPFNITAGYERHSQFNTSAPAGDYATGTDHAWSLTGGYVYGPIKVGATYIDRSYEPTAAAGVNDSLDVKSYQLSGLWHIQGPSAVRAAWTHAGATSGNYVGTVSGSNTTIVGNAGAGSTGANLWQIGYVYSFSKRTQATVNYVKLNNNTNARYALGGLEAPNNGDSQDAWFMSIMHKF